MKGRKKLLKDLQFFIELHKDFIQPENERIDGQSESIYTPKHDLQIVFWFEGGFQISGHNTDLEINFNSKDFLVLSLRQPRQRIIRVPYNRLIAFELQPIENGSNFNTKYYFHNN